MVKLSKENGKPRYFERRLTDTIYMLCPDCGNLWHLDSTPKSLPCAHQAEWLLKAKAKEAEE